jgi:hypothetical protein
MNGTDKYLVYRRPGTFLPVLYLYPTTTHHPKHIGASAPGVSGPGGMLFCRDKVEG